MEILDRELSYLQFERDDATVQVASLIRRIGATLTSDRLDITGSEWKLMLWREEQRAIGGLMLLPDGSGVIGFETSVERYNKSFKSWFKRFSDDLQSPAIE